MGKDPGDEADPYRTINNRSIRESRDNLLLGASRNANGSHHSSLESLKSQQEERRSRLMEDIRKQRDDLQAHYDELTGSLQKIKEQQQEKSYIESEDQRTKFAQMSLE